MALTAGGAARRVPAVMARILVTLVVLVAGTAAFAGTASADARPGGKLFAGGTFTAAGGTAATNIAAWDGVNWSALAGPNGEGADSTVTAMTMYNGKLIVGGSFIEAGGEVVSGIASWDGTTWAPLIGSSGIPGVTVAPLGFVSALTVYNGDLYVGGMFPRAGGTTTVNNIARWNGSEWFAVTGPSGFGTENDGSVIAPVWDLTTVDGVLVAAGEFTSAGGVAVNSVAGWNGSTWSSLGQPLADVTVMAVTSYNGRLVASRSYTENNFNVDDIVWRNGGQWSVLGGDPQGRLDGSVRDLTNYSGMLVAGGFFTQVAGVTVNHVAAWNGSAWSGFTGPAGTGTNSTVYAVTLHQGFLIAGGLFSQAGGVNVSNIARWNGAAWSALPGGASPGVNDIVLSLLST
jgi:hypothetical protein